MKQCSRNQNGQVRWGISLKSTGLWRYGMNKEPWLLCWLVHQGHFEHPLSMTWSLGKKGLSMFLLNRLFFMITDAAVSEDQSQATVCKVWHTTWQVEKPSQLFPSETETAAAEMVEGVKGLPSKRGNGSLSAVTERSCRPLSFLRKQAGEDQRLMLSTDLHRWALAFAPPPQTQFKCHVKRRSMERTRLRRSP